MTYDYAHLICFSPTHSSHMIGETVLQGLGTGHVSETDLTYEKPEENLTIHSGITVIVVPVYGGRIAETALERMEGIYGQDSPAVASPTTTRTRRNSSRRSTILRTKRPEHVRFPSRR